MTWNVLPRPRTLSTQMRPRMRATSSDEMVRPSPVPPKRRVVDASAWANASKMAACRSSGMPMPVSRTARCSCTPPADSPSLKTNTITWPCSVNLMALLTRLTSTWRSRPRSPMSTGTSGATSKERAMPFSRVRSGLWLAALGRVDVVEGEE